MQREAWSGWSWELRSQEVTCEWDFSLSGATMLLHPGERLPTEHSANKAVQEPAYVLSPSPSASETRLLPALQNGSAFLSSPHSMDGSGAGIPVTEWLWVLWSTPHSPGRWGKEPFSTRDLDHLLCDSMDCPSTCSLWRGEAARTKAIQ